MTIIQFRGPAAGQGRFQCYSCSVTLDGGGAAIQHDFEGHEVVRERFRGGRWVMSERIALRDLMIRRLRLKGESITGFVRRLNERMAAVKEEGRSLGIDL